MLPAVHDEEHLLRRSLNGDAKAFSTLWQKHEKMLIAIAIRYTDEAHDAEDLVQDAFITAWQELDKLKNPSKLKSWFSGIVRNKSRSSRAHRRRHSPKANVANDELERIVARGPSPLDHVESKQSWDDLESALERLGPKLKEPLLLYFLLDQNYSNVSMVLGLTEATVRKRVSRAREKLRSSNESLSRFQSSIKKGASAATVLAILAPRKRLWAQTGQSFLSLKVGESIAIAGAAAIAMCFVLTPITKETKDISKRGVATQTSQKQRSVPAQTLQSPSMAKAPASADVLPTSKIADELMVPQPPDAKVILGRGKARNVRNSRMAQTKASLNVSKETTTPLTGVVKEHGPAKVRRGSVIEGPSISLGHYQNEI